MKQKRSIDELLLLLIITIGAVLRFYDFSNLPMTHDELSSFFRLDYSSFAELIEKGVMGDGHPAGVQVFLYYWTKIFGYSEALIKLPFLLMGLGSIPIAWGVSKKWFNPTTALLVAACIATLQFPVMYSQIARPYISGLFFSLLMVLFWTRMLFERQNRKILNAVGYVVFASLSAYNHYFSLLFAFIVGVTGMFYLEKGRVGTYLLSLLGIVILFIPHLNIFFHQLNQEGLHWLGRPDNYFILDYIGYIFHFHWLVYLSVIIIVVAGLLRIRERIWPLDKFRLISLIWFLSPVVIGFIYSRYFMPVVQYSVLIFSFPYLLFFLFSFARPASSWHKIISLALVLVVNISTLVWSRQHYRIFYKQSFEQYAVLCRDFLKTKNSEEVSIILQGNPQYINYYFKDLNPGINYFSVFGKEINPVAFRKILESRDTDYIISGGNQLQHLSLIREYYPYLVFRDFGYTYEYYILSRIPEVTGEAGIEDILFSSKLDTPGKKEHWKNTDLGPEMFPEPDSGYQSYFFIDSTREWGPAFEIDLSEISDSRYNFIDISFEFRNSNGDHGVVACEIIKNGRTIEWKGTSTGDFFDPGKEGDWQRGYLSFRLANIFRKNRDMRGCTLKVYYWNNEKTNTRLDNFLVQVREGNEMVYALIERLN